jgi:hypothetical protein
MAWLRSHQLQEPHEKEFREKFELQFPRTDELPCAGVRAYPVLEPDYDSP